MKSRQRARHLKKRPRWRFDGRCSIRRLQSQTKIKISLSLWQRHPNGWAGLMTSRFTACRRRLHHLKHRPICRRRLIFRRADGSAMELLLADADAACWAEAVDARHGLDTPQGLAICLRLLALIEAMGRFSWLKGFFTLHPHGAELHPALLRAAAALPLDAGGRFDETGLNALLSRAIPAGAPS